MSVIFPPVQVGPSEWDWSRTYLFGVVNVTPDSFSDGGQFFDQSAAVSRGIELAEQGADALDIGGESTRPASTPVPAEQELERVIPVIERLVEAVQVPISIDTYKAEVARVAVAAGASIINDISGGLLDDQMMTTAVESGAVVVLGHLRGEPATMQQGIEFEDVVGEVVEELKLRVRRAIAAGARPERVWVDPGIGFGKTAEQSMRLIAATSRLAREIGYPLMVGPSRKSFIGAVTGQPARERLQGTCAAAAIAAAAGAHALRLHDVGELRPAVRVADAIRIAERGESDSR